MIEFLRGVWTEESFKKALDLELLDAQKDMRHQIGRQTTPLYITTESNPYSHRELYRRELERLGLPTKKKKPSYRQRQKNGRAGRKK